ncbi:hypothetical protein EVA_15211 [gut metagenome]|uniref:Uncharacterized protein n=1 Tax=gut metagenome TaxID=749906 RepID=J9G4E0_9ZZZZ
MPHQPTRSRTTSQCCHRTAEWPISPNRQRLQAPCQPSKDRTSNYSQTLACRHQA